MALEERRVLIADNPRMRRVDASVVRRTNVCMDVIAPRLFHVDAVGATRSSLPRKA